ncbi:hypothetical protein Bbelb_224380 [Branchiostoma belcheri]|nr:hypothetical protein Bbelb_224380 [Branchiostoma belcheri]
MQLLTNQDNAVRYVLDWTEVMFSSSGRSPYQLNLNPVPARVLADIVLRRKCFLAVIANFSRLMGDAAPVPASAQSAFLPAGDLAPRGGGCGSLMCFYGGGFNGASCGPDPGHHHWAVITAITTPSLQLQASRRPPSSLGSYYHHNNP